MRIGKEVRYNRNDVLFDILDNGGYDSGVWGWSECGIEPELEMFIYEQFKRFNVPSDPEVLGDLVLVCVEITLRYAEVANPYSTLLEFSDTMFTQDWETHTYYVKGEREPIDPERMESYAFVPGQAEHWFNHFMAHPDLAKIPHVGQDLVEEFTDVGIEELIPGADQVQAFCGDKLPAYMKLISWATFVWLCGPLGREFRRYHSPLHSCVLEHGEAILLDGNVVAPDQYRKEPRPYTACSVCGVDSFCTELLALGGTSQRLCEHCATQGLVLFQGATCGARLCKHVECIHHPHHSKDRIAALYNTLRGQGLLTRKQEQLQIAG